MAFDLTNIEKKKKKDAKEAYSFESLLKKEIQLFGASFSNKKKEAFYTELSVLLGAGITLKDTLVLISEEQKKEQDRKLIETITNHLIKGSSLSEAIKKQKDFSEYEYYSIKIGEETGNLEKVCEELGVFYKRRNSQRRTILNALSYPIIVISTAILAVVFMLQFVVPMFVDIFKQNKVELPWITKIIIAASEKLNQNFWFLVLGILMLILLRKLLSKQVWYQEITSKTKLKIPYFGELLRKIYISQFTQATTLLINSKVPLLNCISFTKRMVKFYPLQQALEAIEKDIVQGLTLSESLAKHQVFDKKMVSLIKVAEQTNQTEYIFERLTKQYNEDIQVQSKLLSTVLEPIIIIFLGLFVAVILIAMYLPMFKLSTVIG